MKTINLMLATAAVLALTACGQSSNNSSNGGGGGTADVPLTPGLEALVEHRSNECPSFNGYFRTQGNIAVKVLQATKDRNGVRLYDNENNGQLPIQIWVDGRRHVNHTTGGHYVAGCQNRAIIVTWLDQAGVPQTRVQYAQPRKNEVMILTSINGQPHQNGGTLWYSVAKPKTKKWQSIFYVEWRL